MAEQEDGAFTYLEAITQSVVEYPRVISVFKTFRGMVSEGTQRDRESGSEEDD